MNRYERKIYFDRLCAMRAAYETQGVADRTGTISIAEAIAFAERELLAVAVSNQTSPSDQTPADHLD